MILDKICLTCGKKFKNRHKKQLHCSMRCAHPRKPITWDVMPNGCWNCNSHSIGTYGYPIYKEYLQNHNIHHYLYEQLFGIIEKGVVIRHKCDNPPCINPEHLISGTQRDNMHDATIRQRMRRGESVYGAKLTAEKVTEILNISDENQYQIAERFNVDQSVISRIRGKLIWKHIFNN